MLKLVHPVMHRSFLPIFGHNNRWNTLFAKFFSFSYFYCGENAVAEVLAIVGMELEVRGWMYCCR